MRRMLAAGNWKMNGMTADVAEIKAMIPIADESDCDVLICPPAILAAGFAAASNGTNLAIGGQDCHAADAGAHTGDTSAGSLADIGATHVIVGHSERRTDHGETDEDVRQKALAAWSAGLIAIICVGETEAERDAGRALDVVRAQMNGSIPDSATGANTVVAYEPVWAIGTGRVPGIDDITSVHDDMRATLAAQIGAEEAEGVRLLYGGSVKGSNAADIFAISNVDGGLVGGASLKAADFNPIIAAAGKA